MRLIELQERMKKKKLSYVLLINFKFFYPSFYYFTKFEGFGCLVIPKKGVPTLLVPKMEGARARLTKNKVKVYKKGFYSALKQVIGRSKRIGIDNSFLTVTEYSELRKKLKVRFTDVSKDLSKIRAIKTEGEIELIQKSCNSIVHILEKCIKNFRFRYEKEVIGFIEAEARKKGIAFAFTPIVASGKHGAFVHHPPIPGKISKGFLVIDVGLWLNGYCSDITRTFYIGKPTKKRLKIIFWF